jgi:type IV pilus assembly protein PilA
LFSDSSRRRYRSLPVRFIYLSRRPECLQDEGGFSLIELLVVILIVAVLAAIAIPSFLNQKTKAYDAAAKELVHSAQIAAETYATDHSSEYKWGAEPKGVEELRKYEPSLPACPNAGNACLFSAKEYEEGKGYEVVVEAANTGARFALTRSATGVITRMCTSPKGKADCSGSESSSW